MSRERERIRKEIFNKPKEVAQGQPDIPKDSFTIEVNPEVNHKLTKLFPPERIKKIKAKALRRYMRRQDIQWENYLESMSK